MSLFSRIVGNASEVDMKELKEEFLDILIEGEKVEEAFMLFRDLIVFTSKRLVLVDKQGITGKKREYHTIPYKSIYEFSVETSGHFDLDSELTLFTAGVKDPKKIEFKSGDAIIKVQKLLASHLV